MTYTVENHLLFKNGRQIRHETTSKASGKMRPLFLVIHYTVGEDFEAMTDLLSHNKARRASVQLVLGQAGEVAQIGEFNDRLWHAGQSTWVHAGKRYNSLNACSIGIEVCNRGWLNEKGEDGRWRQSTRHGTSRWYEPEEVNVGRHPNRKVAAWLGECGWAKFTDAQMCELDAIIWALKHAYDILEVVGHDDITPQRKQDPGLCFDRRWFGYWNETGSRPDAQISGTPPPKPPAKLDRLDVATLTAKHGSGFLGSVRWRLTHKGLEVAGAYPRTPGDPVTVRRIWRDHGTAMTRWASHYGVPVELLVMTAAVETRGRAHLVREEPGYISDSRTPERVSPGLMQTLIATAQWLLDDDRIDRAWLLEPENSIRVAAAYMARQSARTNFDPPKVAAGYNAGSIRYDGGRKNRWKLLVHPKGTGAYCDAVAEWFNDCFAMFNVDGGAPEMSFHAILHASERAGEETPKPMPTQKRSLVGQIIQAIITLFRKG